VLPLNTYANAANSRLHTMLAELNDVEDLIQQIKETKQALKLMDDQLKAHLATLDEYRASGLLDHYESEDGSYYVQGCRLLPVTRSSWAYSKAVKELQKQEQLSGAATKKESTYLRFDLPKP
jgi:hypothetical protein